MIKPVDRERLAEILMKFRDVPPPRCALVIDDEEPARQMLTRLLEKEGWNVLQAEDGLAALERMKKQRPDLILLDLMMPKMNGFEFVAELHKHDEWQSIPIIVITAVDVTIRDRVRLDGYVEKVLRKSALSEDTLLGEIRDLISVCVQRKQQRQNKPAGLASTAQP